MENHKISRIQADKFKVLSNEKIALKFVLDEAMDNITSRMIEVSRLNQAVWGEIIEQFDLDKAKIWEILPHTREIQEKISKRKNRRGFLDTMEDNEGDENDTSS